MSGGTIMLPSREERERGERINEKLKSVDCNAYAQCALDRAELVVYSLRPAERERALRALEGLLDGYRVVWA